MILSHLIFDNLENPKRIKHPASTNILNMSLIKWLVSF